MSKPTLQKQIIDLQSRVADQLHAMGLVRDALGLNESQDDVSGSPAEEVAAVRRLGADTEPLKRSLIETTRDVYFSIWDKHSSQLTVFSSYSTFAEREFTTEWGFSGAKHPLLKQRSTWDENGENAEHKYWLISLA